MFLGFFGYDDSSTIVKTTVFKIFVEMEIVKAKNVKSRTVNFIRLIYCDI